MPTASARHETPHGRKYLQQLCKHFAHKVEVTYTASEGQCALPPGPATMTADDSGLTVSVTAETAEDLEVAKSIIDSHLSTFAHRENLKGLDWNG